MVYSFYFLFTPGFLQTQYFDKIQDKEKHDEEVLIVNDLMDMIFAARTCKGRGKKCYLAEAVDDLDLVMKGNDHWKQAAKDDFSVYIAEIREVISSIDDDDVVNEKASSGEDDASDDIMMLEAATECEHAKIREKLVARWRRGA